MADQMAPSALPIHGHPLTEAPNISWLAERGVVFDAAYTASPLCSPGRASFMSGLLPSRTGSYDNAAEFGSDVPTFAHYLRQAGYRTVLAGKMHFCGPDQLHGFEERLTTDIYPSDYSWTPDWEHPESRPSWYHNMSSVLDAGPCLRSNQLDFDDEVGFTSERALYDHIRTGDERPFCFVVSFSHPHDPYAIPERFWDMYRHQDIPLPRFASRHPEDMAPHEQRLYQMCAMAGVEVTDDHVRAARRAYYGAITYVDDHIGRLLDILRQTGRMDTTVVAVTSDHGEMLGDRGLWYKMNFYEGAARVPLVVSAPSHFAPRRVSEPVSTMDLLPTLVDLATGHSDSPLASPIDGHSLVEHMSGPGGDDVVTGEYLAEGAIAPLVMLRRGPHKLIHSPADPDQLFDLVADPDEQHNLAADPDSAGLMADLGADVASRWDLPGIDRAVRDSQRRRHAVAGALAVGTPTTWDYEPSYRADRRYIRSHMDLLDLEATARYPRVADAPVGFPITS